MCSIHDSDDGERSGAAESPAGIANGTDISRKQTPKEMDDYEAEEKRQAAAKSLLNYSRLMMTCIGEDVKPGQLRLHLMKQISGMPTSLNPPRFPGADIGQSSSQASGTSESPSAAEGSVRGKTPGK